VSKFNIMAVLLAAAFLAPAVRAEQTLYEQIGGEPVLRKTVEEFEIGRASCRERV